MGRTRILSLIARDETEREHQYAAARRILGTHLFEALREWNLKRYRQGRHTPLIALIDTASAFVHRAELSRHLNAKAIGWRPGRDRFRFIKNACVNTHTIPEDLLILFGPHLASTFTAESNKAGWTSPTSCLIALVERVATGQLRGSTA